MVVVAMVVTAICLLLSQFTLQSMNGSLLFFDELLLLLDSLTPEMDFLFDLFDQQAVIIVVMVMVIVMAMVMMMMVVLIVRLSFF